MNEKITEREAFDAMRLFLEKYYNFTQSDDVGSLLSGMQYLEDGGTADPATWGEWIECVEKALKCKQHYGIEWIKDKD